MTQFNTECKSNPCNVNSLNVLHLLHWKYSIKVKFWSHLSHKHQLINLSYYNGHHRKFLNHLDMIETRILDYMSLLKPLFLIITQKKIHAC